MTETRERSKSPSGRPLVQFLAIAAGWVGIALVVVTVWQVLADTEVIDPIFIGKPSRIFASFLSQVTSGKFLLTEMWPTLAGMFLGFVLAAIAGISIAFVVSQRKYVRAVVEPYFNALNSLPRVALAPIFLIWFGLGIETKIAMSGSLAFFVTYYNTIAGIDSVDRDHLLLARTLGASRRQVFLKFVLPGAVPSIFTGMQLGIVYGMLGTVAGEMLAGSNGFGVVLARQAALFQTNEYFGTLLLLILVTTLLTTALRGIRNRLLRWQRAHIIED